MPRAQGNPETFTGGGSSRFNPASGRYAVLKAGFHVQQVIKDGKPATNKDGQVIPPALSLELAMTECDQHGNPVPLKKDNEPFLLNLKMGDVLAKGVHPGYARSIDDEDPQDLGTDPQQYGNTIYLPASLAGQSDVFSKSSSYGIFTKSLLKAGFDAKAIGLMWAPAFEGMQFELAQMKKDEANAFLGFTGRDVLGLDGPFKIATKIYSAGSGVMTSNGAPPLSIEEMAQGVLKELADQYAGKRLAVPTGAAANAQAKLHYPQTKLPEVLNLLNNPAFLDITIPGIQREPSGALTFPPASGA